MNVVIVLFDGITALDAIGVEYDPAPPLDAGDASRAPAALKEVVLARLRTVEERTTTKRSEAGVFRSTAGSAALRQER